MKLKQKSNMKKIQVAAHILLLVSLVSVTAILGAGDFDKSRKSGASIRFTDSSYLKARQLPSKPTHTEISPRANLRAVVVKFTDESAVRQPRLGRGASLASKTGLSISAASIVLESYLQAGSVSPYFDIPVDKLDSDRARIQSSSGEALADLAGYYSVEVSNNQEAMLLIDQLNALPEIEIAYPEPVAELAQLTAPMVTPDFTGIQLCLRAAPDGVDADYANTVPGGDGTDVKVIDIEGGWRVTHEDLSGNPPFVQIGGQINDGDWRNHGTAVMGEIMGVDNGLGIRGISPGVQWGYSSIGGNSTAGALLAAGNALDTGDVILIELHAPGPHFNFESRNDQLGYVCMEYFQANFDVIKQLSLDGIIVCEAAGNGAENFDDAGLYGSLFDTLSRNSRAIICGAGSRPGHSRLGFSNYGERVNLHGYGHNVVTTGYGGLYSGDSEDSWYTASFSGTSSASPIVTGSVAAMQGAHKAAFGFPMNADEMRTLLVATGTPQAGNTAQHIGPFPNLQAAFDEALGVTFNSTAIFGLAPHTVDFTGLSSKTVTAWNWDFGDGASSTLQSPTHIYTTGGLFDVSVGIESTEGAFSVTRIDYVAVAADTIWGDSASGAPDQQVRIDVMARNSLPAFQIKVPISYAGPLDPILDSATVVGLRTVNMNLALIAINPFGKTSVYTVTAQGGGTEFLLPPGNGPIMSLYFSISAAPSPGDNVISLGGFPGYTPHISTSYGTIYPPTFDALLSLECVAPGDANSSGVINISDATFLIAMIFSGGEQPNPLSKGDANCDGTLNISDATYLIAYIFSGGSAPCQCAP